MTPEEMRQFIFNDSGVASEIKAVEDWQEPYYPLNIVAYNLTIGGGPMVAIGWPMANIAESGMVGMTIPQVEDLIVTLQYYVARSKGEV